MRRLSTLLTVCLVSTLAAGCGGGGTPVVEGATPLITSIEPASGGVEGGTSIVIRGANLANPVAGDYEVLIGGQPADGIEVISDTEVECMTPPGTPGAADVEILTVEGVGGVPGGFMFYPPPTVASITPDSGSRDGGVAVTVTGSGFTANDPGETICVIELKALENIEVIDDTTLTGLTPSSWTETFKDVTVVNRNGSGTLHGAFTYVGPVPLVHTVNPAQGPRVGGTLVTVTGEYFTEAGGELSVRFGSAEASLVTRIDDETLTCMTPLSAAPGLVDVIVGNNNGEGVLPDAFYYIPAPILDGITPDTGPSAGGTAVTITGEGFAAIGAGTTLVSFGPNLATSVVVMNDAVITCITPNGPTGMVDVQILNGNGTDTLADAYEYTFAPAWDPNYGDAITTSDDTNTLCSFTGGFTFDYFGSTYSGVYFGSNGWLGFGSAASGQTWYSSVPTWPCINFVANDMNPGSAGSLHFKQLVDSAVLTMSGVPEYGGSNSTTIQIILHESGAFAVMYANVEATGYYFTVGPGSGQSSYSVTWTNGPSGTASQMMTQYNPTDVEGNGFLLEPNSSGGYDTTVYSLTP